MTKARRATADVFLAALKASLMAECDAVVERIAREKVFVRDILDRDFITKRRGVRLARFRKYLSERALDEKTTATMNQIKELSRRIGRWFDADRIVFFVANARYSDRRFGRGPAGHSSVRGHERYPNSGNPDETSSGVSGGPDRAQSEFWSAFNNP